MKFDLKDILKDMFGKSSKSLLTCTPYRHTPKYTHYMENAVSVEKKILTDRGIDEFNVGHNTRSFEIEKFIDDELSNANKQLNDHLNEYKKAFDECLSEAAVKKTESEQLKHNLTNLNHHIRNLESILSERGPSNNE